MKEVNKIKIICEDLTFQINNNNVSIRSREDRFPKKIIKSKFISTIIAKTISSSRRECERLFLISEDKISEDYDIYNVFSEFVQIKKIKIDSLIKTMSSWVEPTLIVYFQDDVSDTQVELENLAGSLLKISHDVQIKCVEDLVHELLEQGENGFQQDVRKIEGSVVVQENYGKIKIWNPRNNISRDLLSKYKKYSDKKHNKELLDVRFTKGIACHIISNHSNDTDDGMLNRIKISCFKYIIPFNQQGLNCLKELSEIITSTVERYIDTNHNKVSVFVSVRYPIIFNILKESFLDIWRQSNIEFINDDFYTGCSPEFSFFDFLSSNVRNNIFIDINNFPEVMFVTSVLGVM